MIAFVFAFLFIHIQEPLRADRAAIDLGEMRIGAPLRETFRLTNQGEKELIISDVSTTCGCLAPKIGTRLLKPGESTSILVEVNTLSQPPGPISWPMRVSYRSGDAEGSLELRVIARLVSEIKVEPAAISFQIRRPRSSLVTLSDPRPRPLRVTSFGASSPLLKVESLSNEKPGQASFRITATPDLIPGTRSEIVWLATDDPNYPQIQIPVTLTALSLHRVSASPSIVSLSRGSSVIVLLRDREQTAIAIERIETEGPILADGSPASNGTAKIHVRFDAAKSKTSAEVGMVKVYLARPTSDVIRIPVDLR